MNQSRSPESSKSSSPDDSASTNDENGPTKQSPSYRVRIRNADRDIKEELKLLQVSDKSSSDYFDVIMLCELGKITKEELEKIAEENGWDVSVHLRKKLASVATFSRKEHNRRVIEIDVPPVYYRESSSLVHQEIVGIILNVPDLEMMLFNHYLSKNISLDTIRRLYDNVLCREKRRRKRAVPLPIACDSNAYGCLESRRVEGRQIHGAPPKLFGLATSVANHSGFNQSRILNAMHRQLVYGLHCKNVPS